MIIALEYANDAYISVNKILGLNPWIFLVIVLAGIGLLFLVGRMYYLQLERKWLHAETDGRIRARFHKKDLTSYDVMCEDFEGKVKLPKKTSALSFGLPDSLKPPPGHSVAKYLVFADHVWNEPYPDRLPASRQIRVPTINYYENVEHPIMPHNPLEWTQERYMKTSAALYTQAADEATAEAALKRMSGYLKVIEDIVNKVGRLGIIFICSIINIVGILIIGFLAYQAMSNTDKIMKLLQVIQQVIQGMPVPGIK